MNTTHLVATVAAAALALAAVPALGQEGNGNPFPSAVPGTTVTAGTQVTALGAEAYPDVAGRPGSDLTVVADGLLPGMGSEASVQTANSLPTDFEVGTPAYAYAQSVNRHFAAQAERSRVAYAARATDGSAQN